MQHDSVEKTSIANQEEQSVETLSIVDNALHDSSIYLDQYTDPSFENPIVECIDVSWSPDEVNPALSEESKCPELQRSFLWTQMSDKDCVAI